LPYVCYDDYAAAVGALLPDILVAPLDSSRTSMSKCPNKYLEYSMAGAAGVYSDTPPYSQTIVHGRTGLLVRGDDKASWSAAIGRLVEDAPLRKSIAAAARQDVLERFETGVVAPAFAQALLSLIRESGPKARTKIPELAAC
jgi:glycosyltransferase involved in cell wall biosynthesis